MKKSPLKKRSRKKAKSDRELAKLKKQLMKECDGVCELRIPGICTWYAVDPHHLKLQSQGGEHTRENVRMCCRLCHEYCQTHVEESLVNGWMKRRRAMTESEWEQIQDMVWLNPGQIIFDSRLTKRFPKLDERFLFQLVDDYTVITEEARETYRDIQWHKVREEYERSGR